MVEVNTVGSALDTVLAVYTGSAVDALTLIGSNDDFYDFQSRVVFQAEAGTTYFISVDGYQADTGSITLNLAMTPSNDNFADATLMTETSVDGSNIGATAEPGEPVGSGTSGPVTSVWWAWTATTDGLIEFNTFGSNFDTLLAVYTGSSVDNLQLIAANDDEGGLQSQVLFEAVAGTTYYIAVDGLLNQTGLIVLNRPGDSSSENHPPMISDQAFDLNENTPGGATVGTVVASDTDSGQSLTYSIIGGNTSDAFFIDQTTGEIVVANGDALDYEINPTFNLIVQVTDNGTPAISASAVVTIHLTNTDDAPVFEITGPFRVLENSEVGTLVGTVVATDVDPDQTLTYTIVSGNDLGAFAIDSATGAITVVNGSLLNYETTQLFSLTVRVTDSGTPALSDTATVIVFVDDGNEAPVINPQTFSVNENSPNGLTVGTVTATDPDGGQTLSYAIVDGNTNGAFAIDAATGRITVANSAMLDFETTITFVLTIQVTDDGFPTMYSVTEVTINVREVNEAPIFTATGPFNVDEGASADTVLGSVAATDPDAGQTLTYSIVGGNVNGAFAIDPTTGTITVANSAALDYETRSTYSLTVRATDNGTPTNFSNATVTVTLNDLNDAPVLDNSGTTALGTINQSAINNSGTLVSALIASAGGNRITDQDAGAVEGIAIIAADTTFGTWQFSTDGGNTWSALGEVSETSARLLAADSLTRIRFVPLVGFNGTVANAITFRAWDQTSGANGELSDTTVSGGTTAFSVATETASIKVRSIAEQIALLSADVQNLVQAGELSPSSGSQLQSKLNGAKKQLEMNNFNPAANQINSFINLVQNLLSSGDLTTAQADDLTAKAWAIIDSILLV